MTIIGFLKPKTEALRAASKQQLWTRMKRILTDPG